MEFINQFSPIELGMILPFLFGIICLMALLYAFLSKKVTTYLGRESKPVRQLWKKYVLVVIASLIVETIIEFILNWLWGTALETNVYLDYLDTGIIYLFPLLLEVWLVNILIRDTQEQPLGVKLSATIVVANFVVLMGIIYALMYGIEFFFLPLI